MDEAITHIDHLVIYDGECMLCSRTVRLILAHEQTATLKFAKLQSDGVKQIQVPDEMNGTILFYSRGKFSSRSTAVFEIAKHLKSPYQWLKYFSVLPTKLTDAAYSIIAANRYRLFGKVEDTCVLSESLGDRYFG